MLGGAAVSELSVGEVLAGNIDVIRTGNAVAAGLAQGVGSLDLFASGNACAECTAIGQGSATVSVNGSVVAIAIARGIGRVDRDSGAVGVACSTTSVNAIGRIDGNTTVAVARTRVLPQALVNTEVLPLVTGALTTVRVNRGARSAVLPLVVTAASAVLEDIRAASRVELD